MTDTPMSPARERVLDVAERLFSERGYRSIRLRDIANELGIKQSSLYYHFPDGKEELYIEVAKRSFARHRIGLENAIADAEPTLTHQLQAVSRWILSQTPMNLTQMLRSDMPAISQDEADELMRIGYEAMFVPLFHALRDSETRGEIDNLPQPDLLVGSFLSILGGIQHSPVSYDLEENFRMADKMIQVLMKGLEPRR